MRSAGLDVRRRVRRARASCSIAATGSSRRTTASTRATRPFATGTGKAAGTIVVDRRRGRADRAQASRNSDWPHPAALIGPAPAREHRPEAGDAPGRRRGHRGRHRRRRTPTGPSGTCSCASRRAASSGWGAPLVEPGEDVLDAARRLALELDAGHPADPGSAGHGQDLRRRADDPRPRRRREASRRHGPVPQDDQQPARGGRARRRPRRRAVVRIIQKADADTSATIDGRDPGGEQRRGRAALPAGTVDVVAGTRLALRAAGVRRRLRRPVRRRGQPDVARQRGRDRARARGRSSSSATRTSCRWSPRASTRAARPPRRSSTSSATRRRCRPSAASSSRRRVGCTRRSTPSSRRPSTAVCSTTHPETALRVVDGDDPVLSGSGVRWLPTPHTGNGPRSREEAEVVADGRRHA